MKKQFLSTQVCGLAFGVAGALAPFGSALAADTSMTQDKFQRDQPLELYTGFSSETPSEPRGAQGPIREDAAPPEAKPDQTQLQIEREWQDRYAGS